jgi:hypothetical protein
MSILGFADLHMMGLKIRYCVTRGGLGMGVILTCGAGKKVVIE